MQTQEGSGIQNSKEKIMNSQIIYIIISSIGLGFIYPTDKISKLGYSWLLIILLCTAIAVLQGILLCYLPGKFPNKTVQDYSEIILGKYPAKIIGIIITAHFILSTAVQLRIFSNVIKLYLLSNTPRNVIIIVMIATVIYTTIGGMGNILRVIRFFVKLAIIGLILLLAVALASRNYTTVSQIFNLNPKDLIFSLPSSMMLFGGLETIMVSSAFVKHNKSITKSVVSAVIITGILIIITEFVLLISFGVETLEHIRYPILYLAGSISLNSTVTQRFDLVFIFAWMILTFSTISIAYYNSSFTLTHLIGTKCIYPSNFALAPVVIVMALFPQTVDQQSFLFNLSIVIAFITSVVIPAILIIVYKFKDAFCKKNKISCKILGLLAVLILPITLSGCWDNSQINEQSFVIGIGVDKSHEDGKFDITYQSLITKPQENTASKMSYSTLTVTADNFQSAQKQMLSINDEDINMDHSKIFIINEDIAKDGIKEFLYYFFDNINISQNMQFCVSSSKARDIMEANMENDKVPCYYIWDVISINGKKSPEIITSGNIKNLKQDFFQGHSMIMPYIEYMPPESEIETPNSNQDSNETEEPSDKKNEKDPKSSADSSDSPNLENQPRSMKLNKSAVISQSKLISTLDPDMTTILKLIKNQMRTAEIPLKIQIDKAEIFLSLQNLKVKKSFSDTNDLANHPPKLELIITGEGYINTVIHDENIGVLEQETISKMKYMINEEITRRCQELLDYAKNDLKIDIFGFRDHLPIMNMETFKTISKKWNETFTNMEITATASLNISQLGLTH